MRARLGAMTVEWQTSPDPGLRHPILVVAFEGWFDVARAATGAVQWLVDQFEATPLAAVDPEPYFDFTTRRPLVKMQNGDRIIIWPENVCRTALTSAEPASADTAAAEPAQPTEAAEPAEAAEAPTESAPAAEPGPAPQAEASADPITSAPHDLLLIAGVEPHLRWRSFSDDLVEIVRSTGAELVITLGALAEAVPHTRPHLVKGSSTNDELATRLGLDRPTYQGPTGLVGVLHDTLDRQKIPVISLRVGVPHYVTGTTNPKAQRALLEHLQHVTGVPTRSAGLAQAVAEWETQVNSAVSEDTEASAYVQQLERHADQRLAETMPSGDDLAAEFERFLREQREE
jgi:hypothetical protein